MTVYSSEGNMDLVSDVYAYLVHKGMFHGMLGIDKPYKMMKFFVMEGHLYYA